MENTFFLVNRNAQQSLVCQPFDETFLTVYILEVAAVSACEVGRRRDYRHPSCFLVTHYKLSNQWRC